MFYGFRIGRLTNQQASVCTYSVVNLRHRDAAIARAAGTFGGGPPSHHVCPFFIFFTTIFFLSPRDKFYNKVACERTSPWRVS